MTPAERCALHGHGYAEQVVEGNCTKDGYVLLVCIRCHDKKIKEGTYKEATGHTYSVETHNATCTQSGYTLHTCSDCGYNYTTSINATGHTWNVIDSAEVSCTSDGFVKYGCDNCDEEYVVTQVKVGHIYTNTIVPATCDADGYTLHDCDNCDYSYTDSYVEALGHNYGVGQWTWEANGNKALLTLVCEHDESHTTSIPVISTMDKVVEKGECSNYVIRTHTATVIFNGQTYTDVMVIRQGNVIHNFSSEWVSDEKEHWHECVCGEKTDAAEHTFENATITKNPTCVEAGEKTAYCSVCKESKVTVIPATNKHNYVDGICSGCGREESACDHTKFTTEYIDLGKLGACNSIIYYDTCECGEVKILDEDFEFNCDFEDSYEEDEYIDENGNAVMTMHATCHCGIEINASCVYVEDKCSDIYNYHYEFKFNDEVVIDLNYADVEIYHREQERVTIDLSEYNICSGTMIVNMCNACGEITNHIDGEINCNFGEIVEENILDAEGNVIGRKDSAICPDCGFEFIEQYWTEYDSPCEYTEYEGIYIYKGEECIFKYEESEEYDEHEYEYTFEIEGNNCDQDYKVIESCTTCGKTYMYWDSGHFTERRETDLGSLGLCGGTIWEWYCLICGEVSNANTNDYCWWNFVETNSEGYEVYECNSCGAKKLIKSYTTEKDDECRYQELVKTIYMVDGKEVYKIEEVYNKKEHQCEYSYILNGSSCEDGVLVIEKCVDCDYEDTIQKDYHSRLPIEAIDLTKYGACSGTVSYSACPCGEEVSVYIYDNCLDYWGSDEYYDEEGRLILVENRKCDECNLQYTRSYYTVKDTTTCTLTYYYTEVFKIGDTIIAEWEYTTVAEDHDLEYTYTLVNGEGSSCEDGVLVTEKCKDCDYINTYTTYYHDTYTIEKIDLTEYGACSGTITYYTCSCGLDQGISTNNICYDYSENDEYYDEEGRLINVRIYKCYECNLQYTRSYYTVKDTTTCTLTYYYTVVFNIDDTVIAEWEYTTVAENHDLEYTYTLLNGEGSSCEDGVLVTEKCKDCDYINTYTIYYHDTYTIEKIDLTEYGACNGTITYYTCPCGLDQGISTNNICYDYSKNDEYYDEEGRLINVRIYKCYECNLQYTRSYYTVKDATTCTLTYYYTEVFKIGDTIIAEYEYTSKEENHDYETTYTLLKGEGSSCEDGVLVTRKCKDCDYTYDSSFYYHRTYVTEEIDLTEYGVCSGTITYYTCPCGWRTSFSTNDLCYNHYEDNEYYDEEGRLIDVRIYECSECDLYYISSYYTVKDATTCTLTYYYTEVFKIGDTIIAEYEYTSKEENHDYETTYILKNGEGSSCEDGLIIKEKCKDCDDTNTSSTYYHITYVTEEIDLTEYGACSGTISHYTCPCGEDAGVAIYDINYDNWTSNRYYDEEGRLVYVNVQTCSDCGLRYTKSYYTVKDATTCTLTYYYTIVFNIDDTVIASEEYTTVQVDHDYEYTYVLENGEGTSCEDGVLVTKKCKDCDQKYIYTENYHIRHTKEKIELSDLGCVCGGYITISGCACGYYTDLYLDNTLCDWGSKPCEIWIENVITGTQYQVNSSYTFRYYTELFTCAVTDPVDAACAYKIKYAQYWLKDENSCTAYQYETWLIGYNEETGDYQYEITYKTGDVRPYHNYVYENVDNHKKYDCPDCGSYYYENRYYDSNQNLTKIEKIFANTLNNGQNKYHEYICEYAENAGIRYVCREYTKIINANNEEYWSLITRNESDYVGSFGENGKKVVYSHSDSDGDNYTEEYAYVYYKGYSYRIYTYRTSVDSWYKYDYFYKFTDGCTVRTIYTNSEGKNTETTEDNCKRAYRTIQSPTCSQEGIEVVLCPVCEKQLDQNPIAPNDHNWVKITGNWYYCFDCGLENANGISGAIIMEDLTDQYGNGEYYVVGYYVQNGVQFSKYVSLVLADGTLVDILSDIEFTEIDGLRAYKFSKAAVDQWATENGYTDYDVRFTFVPDGSDGSFDYGLTFAEPTVITDAIVDNVAFVDYINSYETKSYTIAPTEDGIWTFTSNGNDDTYGYLCDAEGNVIVKDDDGGYSNNFKITYELKAGETYIVKAKWYSSYSGNMELIFGWEPVVVE